MTQRRRPDFGYRLLLAVAALVGQLLGGAMLLPHVARAAAGLDAAAVICHAGPADSGPANDVPASPHAGHDCALCPGCLGALPTLVLAEAPAVPPPASALPVRHTPKPDATAPPRVSARVPPATGPPLSA